MHKPVRLVAAAGVALLGAAAIAGPVAADATGATVRFEFTGEAQEFVVPAGVQEVDVEACGARGGHSVMASDGSRGGGGLGGKATSTIDVSSGEILWVHVGGMGGLGGPDYGPGGWNGGGEGGEGGGGGGASDVRRAGGALADRVVIGGGGGGGGMFLGTPNLPIAPQPGGAGGGLTGGSAGPYISGGTQTGPGTNTRASGFGGAFGRGASSLGEGGGGGGGLWGGAAGEIDTFIGPLANAGSGGSGLGDAFPVGGEHRCLGEGWVTLTYETDPIEILPSGVLITAEGDVGSTTWNLPVHLSEPAAHQVTVDWATAELDAEPGIVAPGIDHVSGSGTLTFAPGDTTAHVSIEVLGDMEDEPPLLWGEWGVVLFSDPVGASVATDNGFFGAGLFVIVDDD